MAWVKQLQDFFGEISSPLSLVLNADGCREGWVQGELFRRFRPADPTFNVNCSIASRRTKHDVVCGRPPSLVAELKVYGVSGYFAKNMYGKSDLARFDTTSTSERILLSSAMIEAMQPASGSYLGDVLRLQQAVGVSERLMILVLQKFSTSDRFGRAMLAVQVAEKEHNVEFEHFLLRISEF